MKRLFAGEFSVAATYWLGFVGFNIFMRLVFVVVTAVSMSLYANEQEFVGDRLFDVTMLFCVIYCLFLARAQYRAMHNDRQPSAWSWIGLVLILIGTASYAYNFALLQFPSMAVPDRFVREELKTLNLTLPKELEPGLVLEKVSLKNDVMTYHFDYEFDDLPHGRFNMMEDVLGEETCQDMLGYFKGPLKSIEFDYRSGGTIHIEYVSREECLQFAAGQ